MARRWLIRGGLWAAVVFAGSGVALDRWVATAELPPLDREVSVTVLDRDARLLRAYQVGDGRWRLPVELNQVDTGYLAMLLAYEDRRYRTHSGVDPLALMRAAWQALVNGRAVSGASTLTMQVARLLEDASTRSIPAKLRQIRLALALERRLTKDEILALYLSLAPFGGNIEGIRAASLSWFGKEPGRLTPAEAALLVALPQAPEARRPDRYAAAARRARDRVLDRALAQGALSAGDAAAARTEPVPTRRLAFPMHAPHLADRARAEEPGQLSHRLTINRDLQRGLERLVADKAAGWPGARSAAILVADHHSGEILALVASPGFINDARHGWLDMTRAVRSPGSALKPLIYGLAFDDGLAHPESLVEDRPTAFGLYVPTNFDEGYQGTVSVRAALQRSLNVPAVVLLDAVGPAKLLAGLRRAGVAAVLPSGGVPGLAIGLGGVGVRLDDLVALYAAIARGGEAVTLHYRPDTLPVTGTRLLSSGAAWQVTDILAGAPAPVAAPSGKIAFKTGTSYGYRDAWAVGFDGRHVVGVWTGRADAAPVPGMTGIRDAAPLMFQAFSRLKPVPEPFAPPPPDVLLVSNGDLPAPLRRVRTRHSAALAREPQIAFPPNGARVSAEGAALALKVRDGRPPFTWLVDGRPIETMALGRESAWRPDGPGFVAISVIDALGASARSEVYVE